MNKLMSSESAIKTHLNLTDEKFKITQPKYSAYMCKYCNTPFSRKVKCCADHIATDQGRYKRQVIGEKTKLIKLQIIDDNFTQVQK